ncbi:hypothetical protein [uncultured Herbaspirillum sp.]|uniref:hypothetical protein n=1 Tax=uncultured Herbaspirillum sp. TaxID=160236 RepID=UPI002583E6F3|nr:hypothetical protein [uncultured Herbaspirillum sp.]
MTNANPEDFIPIQFGSAKEFQDRPRYLPRLVCENDQLARIVGKYSFTEQEKLECGLNGCERVHWHGWVIQTKDGDETHCGRNCGEREFGVLFKEVEAVFKLAEDRRNKRERLEQVAGERGSYLAEAKVLYEHLSSLGNRVQSVLSEIRKDSALERAFQTCVRSGGRIMVENEDSKRMRSAMGAETGKADLKAIGVIRGIDGTLSFQKVLQELKYQVISPLEKLSLDDLNKLSDKELTAKTQAFSELHQTLSRAKSAIQVLQQFSASSNAQAFLLLPQSMSKKSRTARVQRILERICELYAGSTKST